ncbi:MAG: pilus assembly PilX N-terminal domain-containing protein [Vicinamibacterales bacterium]
MMRSRTTVQGAQATRRVGACRDAEAGVALIVAVLATALVGGVVAALVIVTSADIFIAANVGAANEAFYAAEAVFERSLAEVRDAPALDAVLAGSASTFVDGAPGGARNLPDGSRIDLGQVISQASCHKSTPCSAADLDATRADRPWGAMNPRWRLHSYGPLDPAASGIRSGVPVYVTAMVADDPAETDGDPLKDGVRTGPNSNPGAGVLLLRGEAFGRRGAHRAIEATVIRRDIAARALWDAADPAVRGSPPPTLPVVQVVSWREVR